QDGDGIDVGGKCGSTSLFEQCDYCSARGAWGLRSHPNPIPPPSRRGITRQHLRETRPVRPFSLDRSRRRILSSVRFVLRRGGASQKWKLRKNLAAGFKPSSRPAIPLPLLRPP